MSDREEFEKWASGIGLGDNLVFDTSAGYVGVKYMAYQAWQAAQAQAGDGVNQQLPTAKVWNQAEGRDGKLYAQGWNDCLAAIAAAQEQGK